MKWVKAGFVFSATLVLAACGDVTGDAPKIASSEKPTPVPTPEKPATIPPANPNPGWNEVAQNAFAAAGPTTATEPTLPDAPTSTSAWATAPSTVTAPAPELAESPGLYVRRGEKSPVHWRTWSAEAFNEADNRKVPMLLVIGALWNQNSAGMDTQVFADSEISALINQNFVPVRINADERSDIWARYRMAYEIINKRSAALPLIVFALPDGRPFDIVGSLPPRGDAGKAGLLELLTQAAPLLSQQPDALTQQATSIEQVLTKLMTDPRPDPTAASADLLNSYSSILTKATKADSASTLKAGRVADGLLAIASGSGTTAARDAASELLLERFRSGQRDHVLGGYFQTDVLTGEIQYGKLLPVQADMLSANAHAYAMTGKTLHKEAVTEIIRCCQDWFEAPDGGFFSGQESGLESGDASGYFTWSKEEIASLAGNDADATVFATYLNAKAGEKSNLHVTGKLQQAADAAGVSYQQANNALNTVRIKLRDARMAAEQAPAVDKNIIAGWNGDMICAYLDAAEFTGNEAAKAFALKTADMIIESMVSEKEGVAHVMYKGRASGFGYLDDNVKVASGLVRCYELTQQREYLDSAISLMGYVEARFLDKTSGLYRDTLKSPDVYGLLKLNRFPLEDDITRSPNATAAIVWSKLASAEKKDEYKQKADRLIKGALERRALDNEAMVTWGQAVSNHLNGNPNFKK